MKDIKLTEVLICKITKEDGFIKTHFNENPNPHQCYIFNNFAISLEDGCYYVYLENPTYINFPLDKILQGTNFYAVSFAKTKTEPTKKQLAILKKLLKQFEVGNLPNGNELKTKSK